MIKYAFARKATRGRYKCEFEKKSLKKTNGGKRMNEVAVCACVCSCASSRGQEKEGDNNTMTLCAAWQQSAARTKAVVCDCECGNICLHFH